MRHCTNHYKTYPSLSAGTAWLENYITYGCDLQKYYYCVSNGQVHSLCCYYLCCVMCGLLVVWTPAVVEEVAACHVVAMTTCHVIAMATCLFLTYVCVECGVHALRTRGIPSQQVGGCSSGTHVPFPFVSCSLNSSNMCLFCSLSSANICCKSSFTFIHIFCISVCSICLRSREVRLNVVHIGLQPRELLIARNIIQKLAGPPAFGGILYLLWCFIHQRFYDPHTQYWVQTVCI